MARAEGDLSGRRAFVVEDDALITMFIQDTLGEIGCEVTGVAWNYKDAIEKAKSLSFDVAILDLNLNGQTSFAIADLLSERGMPFVFSTGYDRRRCLRSSKRCRCFVSRGRNRIWRERSWLIHNARTYHSARLP
jgi:CheY-like chemotaxis protein